MAVAVVVAVAVAVAVRAGGDGGTVFGALYVVIVNLTVPVTTGPKKVETLKFFRPLVSYA